MVGGSMSTYRFLPSIYISEHITEVSKKKWFISHGLPVRNCYAIVLAHHSQCALEIMTVEELHKKFRKADHYDVKGSTNLSFFKFSCNFIDALNDILDLRR